jgi:hypothetical protein
MPQKYKSAQHYKWTEDAVAWHRWGPTLQPWLLGCDAEDA